MNCNQNCNQGRNCNCEDCAPREPMTGWDQALKWVLFLSSTFFVAYFITLLIGL